MTLRVKDIEKIWNNGCASLVAGKGGVERIVETYDMMEQPDVKQWLRKHLLLITTGYAIRNDKEALLNLIRMMDEANASALAIKTRFFDDFPKEALQLADELNFPLFLLNNNTGFSEVVFPVMLAIVEAKNHMQLDTRYQITRNNKGELDEKLFMDLLTEKITQEEEAEYRTSSLQWPSAPVRLILTHLDKEKPSVLLEMDSSRQIQAANRILAKYHIHGVSICRKNSCFCIIPAGIPEQTAEKAAAELADKALEIHNCRTFSIISEPMKDYLDLPDTYTMLKEFFLIRQIKKSDRNVYFLRDFQFDRIMLHLAGQEETRDFIRKKLGILEQYDRTHESHLLETLEMLVQKNGSRKQAAEALFLHRNTMAHRLNKIEEILNLRLDDAEQFTQLHFACSVRPYIQ